jgi:hypothetical protein
MLHFRQGPAGPAQRLLPVGAGDDQLGQQGIELRRHNGTGAHPRIQPDPRTGGAAEGGDGSGRGQETAAHVLGIEPELKGVSAGLGISSEAQGLAGGDPELFLDQVDAGGLLRDGVLHLQARVHLKERDGPVRGHQELHRPGTGVGGFPAHGLGGVVDLPRLLLGQEGCRRLFHQFLVPALQGAVPCSHHHHVAVKVRQDLRLHVPGTVQVPFHEAFAAAEGHHGFPDRRVEGFLNLVHFTDHFQPAPAAAEGRLDGHRQAVLFGEGPCFGGRGHRPVAARNQRGACPDGYLPGRDLVAQQPDGFRRRPDPRQAGIQDSLGKVGVLGQEPVSRVDRVRSGLRGDAQQPGDVR